MREFFQSCTSLAFSMSLLTVELMDDITSRDRGELMTASTDAVDAVANAAVDQLGPRLRSIFGELNGIQRSVAGIMFDLSVSVARTGLNMLTDDDGSRASRRIASEAEDPFVHTREEHARSHSRTPRSH